MSSGYPSQRSSPPGSSFGPVGSGVRGGGGVRFGPYEVQHRLADRGGRSRFIVQRAGLASLCQLHLFAPLPPAAHTQLKEQLSACSRVVHRALAATLDVGEDGSRVYVVREHVPGTPLADLVRAAPPSAARAARWTLTAGEALLQLASSEVSVGYLDPETIVLDSERLCLLEVGLSLEPALTGRHPDTAALNRLLVHLLTGAPQPSDQLPRRPRDVPARLWKVVVDTAAEPTPLTRYLVALRGALEPRPRSSLSAVHPVVWVATAALLGLCGAAGALASSAARGAQERAQLLSQRESERDAVAERVRAVQTALAELEREPLEPPAPPRDEGRRSELEALVELQRALLEPRLVGRALVGRWLEALPAGAEADVLRGRYGWFLGQPQQALAAYERVDPAGLSPADAALRALCLEASGRSGARQALEELSQRAGTPEADWARGLLAGRSESARQSLTQAARQGALSPAIQATVTAPPRPAPEPERRALIAHWDRLVRAYPAWESGLYRRSHALYSHWTQGQRQDAEVARAFMRDLASARDLCPNPAYWVYEGKSYVEVGQPWLALAGLERSLRMFPAGDRGTAEALAWYVVALALSGDDARALEQLRALEAFGPQAVEFAFSALKERDSTVASELLGAYHRR
ncbi:MAG: hypothetical protein R3F62_17915 [Planctomycetota bacterium]